MIHANSLKAYDELNPSERLSRILEVYSKAQHPLTDRSVANALGFRDLNKVRPRITEALHDKLLIECGKTRDFETRKTVRVVRLATPEERKDPQIHLF